MLRTMVLYWLLLVGSVAARELSAEVAATTPTEPEPTPGATSTAPLTATLPATPRPNRRNKGTVLRDPTPLIDGEGATRQFESITRDANGRLQGVLVPQDVTGNTTEPAPVDASQVLPTDAEAAAANTLLADTPDATTIAAGSSITIQSSQTSPCVCRNVFGQCTLNLVDYYFTFVIENRCRYPIQVAINGWRYMPNCKAWFRDSYTCPAGSLSQAPIPPTQGCAGTPSGWCAQRTEGWWLVGGATARTSLFGRCLGATAATQAFATKYDAVYYYAQTQSTVNDRYLTWGGSYGWGPGDLVTSSLGYARVYLGTNMNVGTIVQPLTC